LTPKPNNTPFSSSSLSDWFLATTLNKAFSIGVYITCAQSPEQNYFTSTEDRGYSQISTPYLLAVDHLQSTAVCWEVELRGDESLAHPQVFVLIGRFRLGCFLDSFRVRKVAAARLSTHPKKTKKSKSAYLIREFNWFLSTLAGGWRVPCLAGCVWIRSAVNSNFVSNFHAPSPLGL